jgi:hypothetical protein
MSTIFSSFIISLPAMLSNLMSRPCRLLLGVLSALLLHCLVAHADNTPNAVTSLHVSKGLVDLVQRLSVRDELVDLETTLKVVIDETGELSTSLDTTEGTSLPATSCDELECWKYVSQVTSS